MPSIRERPILFTALATVEYVQPGSIGHFLGFTRRPAHPCLASVGTQPGWLGLFRPDEPVQVAARRAVAAWDGRTFGPYAQRAA